MNSQVGILLCHSDKPTVLQAIALHQVMQNKISIFSGGAMGCSAICHQISYLGLPTPIMSMPQPHFI